MCDMQTSTAVIEMKVLQDCGEATTVFRLLIICEGSYSAFVCDLIRLTTKLFLVHSRV